MTVEPYYSDDAVTIYHADARDLAGEVAADVVVTDPPYGIGWRRGDNPARMSRSHDGIANDHDTSVRDEVLSLAVATPAVVFGSFYAPAPDRVRQILVWRKPTTAGVVGSTTGYRRDAEPIYLLDPWPRATAKWSSVLASSVEDVAVIARETGHPHTKPVDLMRTLISRSPDGLVFDPFMGSGTTLRAAKDLGRKAIGIELDEAYCETAARRMGQEVLDLGGVA